MGQWAQQLKAWVCTQKDLLIPAEKKRICWTFNKIPSVQTTNNRTIQLRVTANLPSPSRPEQPPEVPRGKNAPLSLQRPLRYASALLLTSRQFNCVHMAPAQETVVSKSIIVRWWPDTSRYSIVDLSYTEDQLFYVIFYIKWNIGCVVSQLSVIEICDFDYWRYFNLFIYDVTNKTFWTVKQSKYALNKNTPRCACN